MHSGVRSARLGDVLSAVGTESGMVCFRRLFKTDLLLVIEHFLFAIGEAPRNSK
jgi:hypothetical protein